MRFPIRLGVLVALFAACSFIVAQTTTDRVGPITSALRAGQFEKALQILQPELEQSPKNPQLWTLRGIALSGKGDKKEALGAFRHALGISPDYLPALEGAAQIEYENGGKDAVALVATCPAIASQRSDQPCHAGCVGLPARRLCHRGSSLRAKRFAGGVPTGSIAGIRRLPGTAEGNRESDCGVWSRSGSVECRCRCPLSACIRSNDGAASQGCHRDSAAVAARKYDRCECPRLGGFRLRGRRKYSRGGPPSSPGDCVGSSQCQSLSRFRQRFSRPSVVSGWRGYD